VLTHGCGLYHLEVHTQSDEPRNRRVEIFLFDGAVDPPPHDPCPSPGCTQYPQWVGNPEEDIDLCKPQTFDLDVLVVERDDPSKVIVGAVVTVSVPGVAAQTTDSNGRTVFVGLPDGKVHVTATKGGDSGSADADTASPSAAPRQQSSLVGQQPSGGPSQQNQPGTSPSPSATTSSSTSTNRRRRRSSRSTSGPTTSSTCASTELSSTSAADRRRVSAQRQRRHQVRADRHRQERPARQSITWAVPGLPKQLTAGTPRW